MVSQYLLAAVNGAYLAVVLHLLFVLAVCGHSAAAAGLLVAFACGPSLETGTKRRGTSSHVGRWRQCDAESELATVSGSVRGTGDPPGTAANVCLDTGHEADGVSTGQCHSPVAAPPTPRKRHRERTCAATRTPCGDDGDSDFSAGLCSPAREAGVDETLIYPNDDCGHQPCGGPAGEHRTRSCDDYDVLVPQASTQQERSAGIRVREHHAEAAQNFCLTPRHWWVWVAAVSSLGAVCTSAVLFSLPGPTLRPGSGVAAAARAQQEETWAWATTPAAQVLLYVFAGIDRESATPHVRFAWTVACLGVVSAASWCLLLFRFVVQCGSTSSGTEGANEVHPRRHRTLLRRFLECCGRGVRLGLRLGASTPFSLVWIAVAGVGQTTLLGVAALTVAAGMVLLLLCTLPRLSQNHRSARRDLYWAAYVTVLWCIGGAQIVLQLEPMRRVLIAGEASSTRRRWLTALGVESVDSSQSAAWGWHVVFAVGLWCAVVEQLSHRAADNNARNSASTGSCGASPTSAHVSVYRTRVARAIAHQEEAEWTEAVNQQRAAHGKLALLRLERRAPATRSPSPPRGRHGISARRLHRGGVQPLWSEESLYEADEVGDVCRHAPFGSNGSRCGWLDAASSRDEAKATTAASEAAEVEAGVPIDCGDASASSHVFTPGGLHALSWASTLLSLHGCAGAPRPSSAVWNSSPCHSLTSAYSCRSRRRAPWQYPELHATQATPFNAEPVTSAVEIAEPLWSPEEGEDEDEDEDWMASKYGRRRAARAPTQSPWPGGDRGNSDAMYGTDKCGYPAAQVSGSVKSTPYWRSPVSSCSGTNSPVVFSVSKTGPRAACAGLRRTSYADSTSPCQSGGSVCGLPIIDPPPSPRTCEEAAASWEALWHGGVSVAASARPDDAGASVVLGASVVEAEPSAVGALDCEEEALRSTCERLREAVQSLAEKLARRLRACLLRHIVVMEENGADEELPVHGTQGEKRSDAAVVVIEAAAAAPAAPDPDTASAISLCRLLALSARQHWGLFCAVLMLIHFAVSGTAANLVPSAASLVYAIEQRPWPRAAYWRFQVVFSALVLVGKVAARVYVATVPFAVAQQACWWVDLLLLRVDMADAAWSAPLGPRGSVAYQDMWVDIALAGAVLAAVAIQWIAVYADVRLLWPEIGDRSADHSVDVPVTTGMSTATVADTTPAGAHLPGLHDSASVDLDPSQTAPVPCCVSGMVAWLSACKAFARRCNSHRRGAGADYYALQLFCDAVALALFGWAYYAIVPNVTATSKDNLVYAVQHNRLPGIFVATALGLVVLMFVERILYVLQARVAKYALHCLLAVVYHTLYLVWRVGQESSGDSEKIERGAVRAATSSAAMTASVSLLLTVKLASLWFSALQLRHGYAVNRLHDPFTIQTDLLHWFGHVVFRAVPFLLELRVLLDWSFSATTLKLQHWMLLEDIHHTVYRRYVDMHDLRSTSRHQGRRFPYLVRLYQGVLGFTVILFVLFFPLFWYSTFSPQVRVNGVTAWSTDIAVAEMSTTPLFSADAALTSSNFYHAVAATFSGSTISAADLLRYAAVTDTWQTARVASCSSRMWTYTPAAVDALISRGGGGAGLQLLLRLRVTRSRASEATLLTVAPQTSYTLPAASQARLMDALQAWRAADEAASPTSLSPVKLSLSALYTPFVLSASAGVTPVSAASTPAVHCTLTLHRVGRYQGYSCVACAAREAVDATSTAIDAASVDKSDGPFLFIVASSDVTTVQSTVSLIPSVGIIALYTSFVLVIGAYIRNYFAGDAHRVVLLQLANPEPVAELLRYLYLARSSANNGQIGDLFLEQLLFLELLDLLRSPERLLRRGGSRVDDYEGGLYRADLYDATKQPFALPRA